MVTKILSFVCVVFVCAIGDARAYSLDSASFHIIMSAVSAETSKDIARIVASAPIPRSQNVFWTDAIGIGESPLADEPPGRASIVRLMEAALIYEGVEPDSVSLDRLTTEDIAAMRDIVGFPDHGDLLLYLLNRGPSLHDSFGFGRYTAIRIVPERMSARILLERADRPYLGIGTEFEISLLDPERDPVYIARDEHAKTRHIHLSALPDIILAAKAFRAAKRAPENQAVYPLLIAVQAVNRAFMGYSRDFRPVVYSTEWEAINALRSYSGMDPMLLAKAQNIEFRVPRVKFFFRLFEEASLSYAKVAVPSDNRRGKVWAAWGEGLSLFAYGADAGPAFERVVELIGPDTPGYAKIVALFLSYLPLHDAAALGDVKAWRAHVTATLGDHPVQSEEVMDVSLGRDFRHMMATIGRPDIASRFLMDQLRLSRARGIGSENDYIRWLAPFIHEYCYAISFRLSATGDWKRRAAEGYNVLLDFVDNFNDDGQLVSPGEVVTYDGHRVPYPALSPEEDCTAAQAVYGIVDNPLYGILGQTAVKDRATIILGIEAWVRDAMSRSKPAPSIAPYLKLVWLEWFAQVFEELKDPSFDVSEFRYSAITASPMTVPDRVRELLQHRAVTPHQRHMIELFLETREFLEEMYPR